VVGLLAGYKKHAVDEVLMRIMDLVLSFPNLVLALLLVTVLGSHDWFLVLIVAVTFMPNTARVIRAVTVQVAQSDFVKYAEGTGMSTPRLLAKEILPNLTPALTVEFGIRFTNAIGLLAGLDYIGFGVQAPTPDWGLMIQENQLGLTVRPLAVLLPVAAIALLAVGANLVTDGIGKAAAGTDRVIEG
jgi:peptide/nickel transport system permease protein